jgi:4'-phosphopantetheinyl transferase
VRRAQCLRGDRRSSYLLSHAAARLILAAHHRLDPARLRWGYGRNGKPGMIQGTRSGAWSLSHSGDWALVAVGGEAPIGVDVLNISLISQPERLARRFLPPEEVHYVEQVPRAMARRTRCALLLSRREACIKAVGGTLAQSLKIGVHRTGVVRPAGGDFEGCRWHLVDLAAPSGYVAALAALSRSPAPVTQRLWTWPSNGIGGLS